MAPDSDHSAAAGGAGSGGDLMERAVDGAIRLGRAWKALSRERRNAAIAAGVLWLTLFLPWYQASVVSRNPRTRSATPIGESINGWGAFSGVEALILILSLGTLVLLFLRVDGRLSFEQATDGWVVTVAGGISVFLVVLGLFNAPSPASRSQYVLSTGLEWGIFLALLAAIGLTWAGGRMRRSLEDDPLLAGRDRPSPASNPMPTEPASSGASEPATRPVGTSSKAPHPSPNVPATAKPRAKPPVGSMTEANRLGVVEPLTDESNATPGPSSAPGPRPGSAPTPAAGEPLTAAGAQRPRPVRAPSASHEPAAEDAETAASAPPPPAAAPDPAPDPASAPRSNWRPAERPAWKDPDRRPTGWLTAPRQKPSEPEPEPGSEPDPAETEAPTRHNSRHDQEQEQEQLTIPLDPDE